MKKISFNENWTFKTDKHVIENLILPHDAQLLDGRKADLSLNSKSTDTLK